MDFKEGDYLINIQVLKANMLDALLATDSQEKGADIRTYEEMLNAFRRCIQIITYYGSKMGE